MKRTNRERILLPLNPVIDSAQVLDSGQIVSEYYARLLDVLRPTQIQQITQLESTQLVS